MTLVGPYNDVTVLIEHLLKPCVYELYQVQCTLVLKMCSPVRGCVS